MGHTPLSQIRKNPDLKPNISVSYQRACAVCTLVLHNAAADDPMQVVGLDGAPCPGPRDPEHNSPFAGVTFGLVRVERQVVVARTGRLAVSPEGRALLRVVDGTALQKKKKKRVP